jgi:hypothetical protein
LIIGQSDVKIPSSWIGADARSCKKSVSDASPGSFAPLAKAKQAGIAERTHMNGIRKASADFAFFCSIIVFVEPFVEVCWISLFIC